MTNGEPLQLPLFNTDDSVLDSGPFGQYLLQLLLTPWLRLMEARITVTLNFSTLLVLLVVAIITASLFVRYRVLTNYSRLPLPEPVPKFQGSAFRFRPIDYSSTAAKSHPRDYAEGFMGSFLQSIKFFGYLEPPVFHELAKRLQTRKIPAGEFVFDESLSGPGELQGLDRAFYIVVEGKLDVFVRVGQEHRKDRSDSFDECDSSLGLLDRGETDPTGGEAHDRLRLLYSAGPSDTVSSLFTILGLLTDSINVECAAQHVNLRTPESPSASEPGSTLRHSRPDPRSTPDMHTGPRHDSDPDQNVSPVYRPDEQPQEYRKRGEPSSPPNEPPLNERGFDRNRSWFPSPFELRSRHSPTAAFGSGPASPKESRNLACLENMADAPDLPAANLFRHRLRQISFDGGLAARATQDTTVVAIPPEAFLRLSANFPQAAAQMAQVILTRFQAITLRTIGDYMKLGDECLKLEARFSQVEPMQETGTEDTCITLSMLDQLREATSRYSRCLDSAETPSMKRSLETFQPVSDPNLLRLTTMAGSLHSAVPEAALGRAYSTNESWATDNYSRIRKIVFDQILLHLCVQGRERPMPANTAPKMGKGHRLYETKEVMWQRRRSLRGRGPPPDQMSTSSASSSAPRETGCLGSDLMNDRFVRILFYEKGTLIVDVDDSFPGLFYLIDGLAVLVDRQKKHHTFLRPGSLIGYLSCLTGFHSLSKVVAHTDICIGLVPQTVFNRWMECRPDIVLKGSKNLLTSLSTLFLHVDIALEWQQLDAGRGLYRQGDSSDCCYIIVHGRLRAIAQSADATAISNDIVEYGRGESIGELEMLTSRPRPVSLHAIRESEVARIPKTLFTGMSLRGTHILLEIGKMLVERSLQPSDNTTRHRNVTTIALLPSSDGVPIQTFAEKIKGALEEHEAKTLLLNQTVVNSVLGKHAFRRMGKLKLTNWLSLQEAKHRVVLYVASGKPTSFWVERCIQQADLVLVVALAWSQNTELGPNERSLLSAGCVARKELVLVHQTRSITPGLTQSWLKHRPWVESHHHVQMRVTLTSSAMSSHGDVDSSFGLLSNFGQFGQLLWPAIQLLSPRAPIHQKSSEFDFGRLARWLLGKSIALVLGGGGARGIAHLGILKVLEEADIPVDMIGGTSIGALVGGLYATGGNHVGMIGPMKFFSHRMTSKWRKLMDLTFPVTSYFTGHEFNRSIWKLFGETHVEDLWIPYFAVTTNITMSRLEVHTSGYLWRFVRASMSLSGFLPPICEDGHLLLDGGYINNLPVNIMHQLGADKVIAVDVGSKNDTSPIHYGDSLSAWSVLLNRYNPFSRPPLIPTLSEIQSRLAYVSSVKQLQETMKADYCVYLRPPVATYATLAFDKYEPIFAAGYEYGRSQLRLLSLLRKRKCLVRRKGRRNSF